MIKISHLSKKFGNLEVLKDINLDIEEGEVVCIIGPSGSGKSTFLRCINQLESPSGGIVEYEGKNLLDKKCDIRKFREEGIFPSSEQAITTEVSSITPIVLSIASFIWCTIP